MVAKTTEVRLYYVNPLTPPCKVSAAPKLFATWPNTLLATRPNKDNEVARHPTIHWAERQMGKVAKQNMLKQFP